MSLFLSPNTDLRPEAERLGRFLCDLCTARLYQSTNGPKSWPATAALFASAILVDDPLPLYKHVSGPLFMSSSQSELSRVAVGCADSPPTTKGSGVGAEEAAKEMMRVLDEVSPHFGGSVSLIEQDGNCEFWTQREGGPKGFRFTGPWNVRCSSPSWLSNVPSGLYPLTLSYQSTLGTPMLIISNTGSRSLQLVRSRPSLVHSFSCLSLSSRPHNPSLQRQGDPQPDGQLV